MQDLGIRVLFMGNNFTRLLGGLWITVKISLISVGFSIILGILLGMVMTLKNPVTRCITKVYLEFIRIMPQLVLLFLVYFGATKSLGIQLSGQVSAVIVFTLWGTAEIKAPELLREAGVGEDIIHAVCSHGYELTVDVKPEHEMEKVLYAADELTGLIGATALMRPSKSVQDMEVKSVKKKFKSANFAAGCSREVIQKGADMLGWDLTELIQKTIYAMRSCEAEVQEIMGSL